MPPRTTRANVLPRQRGSGRPRASDGEQTRLRIIDSARRCFGEFGYRETSNSTIAEAAGLTAGMIYHYFENKRAMFLFVHEETQKEILRVVLEAVSSSTSFV